MIETDIDTLLEIERQNYTITLNEPAESFHSFLIHPKNKCYVMTLNVDGNADYVIGYFIAHPYLVHLKPPQLHETFSDFSEELTDWFIHDMAFNLAYHKMGFGTKMLNYFLDQITTNISLVAVNDAHLFWRKYGFVICELDAEKDLHSFYGNPKFMIRYAKL